MVDPLVEINECMCHVRMNECTASVTQMVIQQSGLEEVTCKNRAGITKRSIVHKTSGKWEVAIISNSVNGESFGNDGSPSSAFNIKLKGTRGNYWLPWPWAWAAPEGQ